MTRIHITLAVEDYLSETIAKKILSQSDNLFQVVNCLSKGGYGYLQSKINAFNEASKYMPFFVLTDQDRGCPPEKIRKWLKHQANPNLLFRIAVMEVESWVMAHRKSFADYFSVPIEKIPLNTDEIDHPKEYLLYLVNRSRSKRLRDDIVPNPSSTAKTGPDYHARLSDFIRNYWDVNEAKHYSGSLSRTYNRIQEFRFIPPPDMS